MTDQSPELFPERPVRSDFARAPSYRARRIITCLVMASLIGGGVYCIVKWKRGPSEIPTIKAELPLKQKPEQPGGIDIPNQDVLAYQQIDNSGNKPVVEHLMPPPEMPQAANAKPPAPAPVESTDPPSIESLEAPPVQPITTTVSPKPPAAQVVTKQPVPETPVPSNTIAPAPAAAPAAAVEKKKSDFPPIPAAPLKTVGETPAVQPHAVTNIDPSHVADTSPPVTHASEPVIASVSKPSSGKGGFRIQLASFPDKETADQQMAHVQKKYAGQLGNAKLHLIKADLGARGIYWRLQSNPMTDTEAREICEAIKNLKAGCILVKP